MTILKYFWDNTIRIYSFKEKDSSIKGNLLFKYDKIFKNDKTQNTIYEKVGKRIVGNVKKEYNGTNFVWSIGQSGSGNTYLSFINELLQELLKIFFISIKGLWKYWFSIEIKCFGNL